MTTQPPLSRGEALDFELLDLLSREPELSQREMAERLGLSLGRMNYCLKALRDKGAVKLRNFQKSPNKLGYAYVLTPTGISQRTRLASAFLARKRAEYDRLKAQIDALQEEFDASDGEVRRA
jgi:EPS-associated MarR family transcriptional regulator